MSYIALFSYYQFDNWAYPSYVSSNTPWFFNGVRIQIFPTEHLKIEPWFTKGWHAGDMGCEHGGGVSCAGNSAKGPKQSFLGYMIYNRLWFDRQVRSDDWRRTDQ